MNTGRKEYTFLWFIENYSYCWHQIGGRLVSPEFTADGLKDTSWNLRLYPRGRTVKTSGKISVSLARCDQDAGPEIFNLNYEIAVLAADGSSLRSDSYEFAFEKGIGHGRQDLVTMEEVLSLRKADYLPQDTLSVYCKMWIDEGSIHQARHFSARTRIGIEKISFLHKVEKFSILKPKEKNTLQIRSHSKTGCVFSSGLYFTDDPFCDGMIVVEITSSKSNYSLAKQKLSLQDGAGHFINCGGADNRLDASRKDIKVLLLSVTSQLILNRKSEYLPNDELSLIRECTFSTGVELQKIEETRHDVPMANLKQIFQNTCNRDGKLYPCTGVVDDMKALFVNQYLTDVQLKTKTKVFSAHKAVLCARSSVFKAMMSNDMKEKNSECIQIDDLEENVVEQLLLFLYTDNPGNLLWESAMKLYYASDKYAVEKLKLTCASFLVNSLSVTNVSDVLLLADAHNDSDLRSLVEYFIFEHHEEVFGSNEWVNLIKINPILVSKTMCQKYKRKKGGINLEATSSKPHALKHSSFNIGDKVQVVMDVETLKIMQVGHGEWNDGMAKIVPKVGIVLRFTDKGDICVQYDDYKIWILNPEALKKLSIKTEPFSVGETTQIKDEK